MTEVELCTFILSVLQSSLRVGGETVGSNGYNLSVKINSSLGEGFFDFIPNYPVSYPVDKKLNSQIFSILAGALYPYYTLFPGGPNFVSTSDTSNINCARALRFYFKVGTYKRLRIDDMDASTIFDGKLPLMTGFEYDFTHNSGHIAISGSSGSGKTMLAEYLLQQFWLIGSKIVIIDPKLDEHLWYFATKHRVEYHYPHIGANLNAFDNEVQNVLSTALKEIGRRQSFIISNKDEQFNPFIVFVDEGAAYSTKQSRSLMEKIVLMGRACKVWLIISAQSMDATSVISSTARDSMGLRVLLSASPTQEECRYLFKSFDPSDVVIPRDEFKFGMGLIQQKSDGRILPFLAPYIVKL